MNKIKQISTYLTTNRLFELAIVAVILSKTSPTDPGYHVHEDGSTHYYEDTTTTQEYHVHDDGVTHYGEH